MLALVGGGLGAFAYSDYFGGSVPSGQVNRFEPEPRTIAIVGPTTGPSKAAPVAAAPVARPAPPAPPRVEPPKRPNPCDPPYTIDPATGRKKYKMECLK